MVADKLATLKKGSNQHSPIGGTSQSDAADILNVGKRIVERARSDVEPYANLQTSTRAEAAEILNVSKRLWQTPDAHTRYARISPRFASP
jgi:hypothetical protein|tara:strand:- start:5965 stop:6234 length:270 start_codon:yes stop_codon:yes gene_type:complete